MAPMRQLLPRVARLVAHSSRTARGFARSSSSAPPPPPPPPPAGAAAGGAAEVSPWRVLGLARHASETEIRGRFRELAYKLHPDLNHNNTHAQIPLPGSHARADQKEKEEAMMPPFPPGTGGGAGGDRGDRGGDRGDRGDREHRGGRGGRGDRGNPPVVYINMADVVHAYEALMSGAGGAARDSRVGSSVEKFTIRELMDDEKHTVVPLTMVMDVLLEAGDGETAGAAGGAARAEQEEHEEHEEHEEQGQTVVVRGSMASHANRSRSAGGGADRDDDPAVSVRVHASGFDAVADLKRDLQAQFGRAWGLQGRRIDHENVAIGWELVHDATVLCPNYFLEDYGIETGDTVHAVIRDYDD